MLNNSETKEMLKLIKKRESGWMTKSELKRLNELKTKQIKL